MRKTSVVVLGLVLLAGIGWAIIQDTPAKERKARGPDVLFTGVALGFSFLGMSARKGWQYEHETDGDLEGYKARRAQESEAKEGVDRSAFGDREKWMARRAQKSGVTQFEDRLSLPGIHRFSTRGKMKSFRGLLDRDMGPLTFDVATHSDLAEVSEYRGVIHWQRDVIEKILSVFLVIVFSLFLGRATLYVVDFLKGDASVGIAVEADILVAARVVALALIIDGVLLVAAMTDAPGIGRTLDSLIVVLAGVVIMYFDPKKLFYDETIPRGAGNQVQSVGILLIIGVAFLFLVRWTIRHHTIREWRGDGE